MEIWELGAVQQAAAIRSREASSREVVSAHLERIEAINPAVNALRVVLAEEALAAADEADRREVRGPLHGVPVSIKENVDVAGTATTWGVAALAEAVSPIDAPVVANLRAAGAIVLARGNLPDFALRWHTDNALSGATLNPRDPGLTPGGSSGGEAVAIATGMVPLAVGTDLGGSLRWPSQVHGTLALRPSHGCVPHAGLIPEADEALTIQEFSEPGPMARRVEDLRVALDAMRAPSPRDPWHVPGAPAAEGPRRAALALPADVAPSIAQRLRAAADALAAAGWEVVEVLPPELEEAERLWRELLIDDVHRAWPVMSQLAGEGARAFMDQLLAATPPLDAAGIATRWTERQRVARAWSEFQATTPIVIAPICLREPFAVGADIDDVATVAPSMRMVVPVNLLGLPAAAVPAGHGPGGIQLIGPRFGEALCLDAAAAIEDALGAPAPIDPMSSPVEL